MNTEVLKILDTIKQCGKNMLNLSQDNQVRADILSLKIPVMAEVISEIHMIIPQSIYDRYSEFFSVLTTFCRQCGDSKFLLENRDNIISSLQIFDECLEELEFSYREKVKRCPCCGQEVIYASMPGYYAEMKKRYSDDRETECIETGREETINKEEYLCPYCGASDRDRLIVSFLRKEGLQKAPEGMRLLQIAPAASVSAWIEINCPHIVYETTDLNMDQVSFRSDIMNMNMVQDATYDVIICSHVLEHVADDRKALSEMKRILKPDGKIIFLVPVSLHLSEIDEELGLSEEENWRRFGQGDHCRRYGKKGLCQRLEEQFHVHKLGINFFGQDIFVQCGLTDTSTLYILTKSASVKLNMEDTTGIDEKLCYEGPLVSVILSCYNHEMFVADAIESVIAQSYKNVEILVADDASTDGTVSIMKRYSSYFTKEFYFTENAGGRERVLVQNAKGKYIALMHSDDIWEKDKLAFQVEYMEKHGECGICFTWALYTDDKLREYEDSVFLKSNKNQYEWMRFFWEHGNALCNPSSLQRREISLYLNSKSSASRQLPDFFRWIDILQITSIYVLPKVMVRMRRYQKAGCENVSSATEQNIFRSNIEEGCEWLSAIRDMEPDFFKNAFSSLMRDPRAGTKEAIQCEKYFLMLNHSNPFVQNSAVYYFYEIYNDVREYLETRYHYTKKDFGMDIVRKGVASFLGETNEVKDEKRQGD